MGVALFLPTSIALIVSSLFFVLFAFLRPQQSLLFLVVYVSIRPFLLEINPGLKLIGDLITLVAFAKLVVSSGKEWKSLFTFKWFEWAFFAFLHLVLLLGSRKVSFFPPLYSKFERLSLCTCSTTSCHGCLYQRAGSSSLHGLRCGQV